MLQIKIINHDGQCRGRPPTRGDTRDGPWGLNCRLSIVDCRLSILKPGTRNPKPGIRYARDWPNYTCSVNREITQDRHEDRLKVPDRLADNRPHGRGMPACERIFT